MADIRERINVEGNFRQQVQAFVNGLIRARSEMTRLILGAANGGRQINRSMTLSQKAVERYANQFVRQGSTVENAIRQATAKVERYQQGAIERTAKRYMQLGRTIQDAYSQAQKDVNTKWNGSPNVNATQNSDNILNTLNGFLGTSFGRNLTILGGIMAGVKAIQSTFKLANNISSQTLGVVNKLSGNMLSVQGAQQAFQQAEDFELVKTNIDVLSRSVKGANSDEIYKNATKLAVSTMFSEKEMAKNAEWMLKAGMNPSERTLTALANLGSLAPEYSGDHAGFSVNDMLDGQISSVKRVYGITWNKLLEFQKTLDSKNKKKTDDALVEKSGGYAVKDRRELLELFTLYVEKNYGSLADEQSRTMKGLISTVGGQLEQIASDLIGFNTKEGTTEQGTVFSVIKEAIGGFDENGDPTGLTKWINDLPEEMYFKDLQQDLGDLVQTAVDTVSKLNEKGMFENLVNVADNFVEKITDLIDRLDETGQLDKIAKDFPKLVEASLNYELAKVEALAQCEPLIPTAIDFLNTMTDFIKVLTGVEQPDVKVTKYATVNSSTEEAKEQKRGIWKWLNEDGSFDFGGNDNETKTFNDYTVNQMLEKDKTISAKEKETVKEIIEKDGVNQYTININGNMSDTDILNKLIAEIERIQKDR